FFDVVNTQPYTVVLIYNCHYIVEICKNAENFAATLRGQNLHPVSGLPNDVYGFDFDIGEWEKGLQQPSSHQDARRDESCPRSWKDTHSCPETDQKKPWRNDGEWFTIVKEPNIVMNELANKKDVNGNVISYSKIRYSCDEFPPATWYGGSGASYNNPAETRCAAISCNGNQGVKQIIKAEQDCKTYFYLFVYSPQNFPTTYL
ncbi:hypothetical protein QBC32DRAFT_225327, partial [Pseudoneurospora amorphoporcata]